VVAYADDVTIFVTCAADFAIIEKPPAYMNGHQVTASTLENLRPSRKEAGVHGRPILGIAYHPHVTIIGVTFWGTIEQTMKHSWARLTGTARAQAKRAYTRGPCLATRMLYVNTFLLSKIWYTAQIPPAPNIHTQLTNAVTWYIWRGTVFRVPVSTLQRPKQTGGLEMPDTEAKCTALLLYRMYLQGQRNGTVTAAWIQALYLTGRQANPPHATKVRTKLAYRYVYAVIMAYITPPEQDKAPPPRFFRKRIYAFQHPIGLEMKGARDVRIMTQHPITPWYKV